MENKVMYAYYNLLCDRYPIDMLALKKLKWCDGSIQKYIEVKWNVETDTNKERVYKKLKY